MTTLALVAALALGALAAPTARQPDPAATKLVQFFLDTGTADLPPERVPVFLAVDPAKLPAKLRDPFTAKKIELLALKKNSDSKYKPPLRMLGKDSAGETCGPPQEMATVGLMLKLGFERIDQEEEEWLMRETRCSECELRTEFSLTLVTTPPKRKGEKKELHYLMHSNDPIMALIATHRAGVQSTNTNFFGMGSGPKCR